MTSWPLFFVLIDKYMKYFIESQYVFFEPWEPLFIIHKVHVHEMLHWFQKMFRYEVLVSMNYNFVEIVSPPNLQ